MPDHYGVEAELLVGKADGDVLEVPPTVRTAVAPGIAWTVLPAATESEELVDFFAHWAAWDCRDPVPRTGIHQAYGPVTIMMTGAAVEWRRKGDLPATLW